ncbi:MAG TPA: hypothetical protein VJ805_02485 [Nitrospiraceae bacterium]|nr:hypothetical protein [Nitrospiraceae bacterium]
MVPVRIGMAMIGLLSSLFGCGLDGISGQLVRIDQNLYVVKTPSGEEYALHIDNRTRRDPVAPGDNIHAYVGKDGHAEFVQRLDP